MNSGTSVPEAAPPAPQPEAQKPDVLDVFKRYHDRYEHWMENLAKTPSLNGDQTLALYRYETTKAGKTDVLDKDRAKITHKKFKDPNSGQEFTSTEGIAVEGLIIYLEEKLNSFEFKSDDDKAQLQNDLDTLKQNSKSFNKAHHANLSKQGFREGRKALEAQAFYQFRQKYGIAGDQLSDWQMAERILNERMELTLPKLEKKPAEATTSEGLDGIKEAKSLGEVVGLGQPSPAEPEKVVSPAPVPSVEHPARKAQTKEVVIEPGHKYPFVEDNPDNQTEKFSFDEAKKATQEPSPQDTDRVKDLRARIGRINSLLADPEFQKNVPRQANESDADYRIRALEILTDRMTFLGDHEKAADPLSKLLIDKGLRGEVVTPQLLQAVEAVYFVELDQQNQEKMAIYEKAKQQGKFDIATLVSFERGIVDIGGSASIYEDTPEGRQRKEMAERDNRAALLLTNALAGLPYEVITDPITGDKRTISFNEKMEPFLEKRRQAKTPEEKDEISRRIQGEYKNYLNRLNEVMVKREKPINPFGDDEIFQKKAYEVMQDLKPPFNQDKLNKLLELYQQNPSFKRLNNDVRNSTIGKIKATFEKDMGALPDFLGTAQKGIDFLERRMELLRIPKPELHDIPQEIYAKRWKEDGDYHRYRKGKPAEAPSTAKPSEAPSAKPGEGEELEQKEPSAAPALEAEEERRRKGELPTTPAPIKDENKPPPPVPAPTGSETITEAEMSAIFAAAAEDKGLQNVIDDIAHGKSVEEELFRNRRTKLNFVDKFADWLQKRRTKHILLKPLSLAANVTGGILNGLNHPVRNILQKYLTAGWVEEQYKRFDLDFQGIVKQQSGLDPRVPIQAARDLMTLALQKGSERRNKWGLGRIGWALRDMVTNPFGISQTSEQILAKRWLQEELAKGTSMDAQLKEEFDKINSRVLFEVDAEGKRFASLPEGVHSLQELTAKGMTLEQVNRDVLGEKAGETRRALASVDAALAVEAETKLKEHVKAYVLAVQSGTSEEQAKKKLLTDVNSYLMGKDFRGKLSPEFQKEFSGIEVANNILSLADQAKEHWKFYEQVGSQEGKTKWDEFHLEILIGKGKWGGVRGEKEWRFFGAEEKILQKLAERRWGIRNELAKEAVERVEWYKNLGYYGTQYLENLAAYGGSFALGAAAAAQSRITSIGIAAGGAAVALPFAPLVGTAALAGTIFFKERGLDLPGIGRVLKGRLAAERTQLSRETALRRADTPGAVIRKDLTGTLVEAIPFEKLRDAIVQSSQKEGELTEQEVASLALALTDADARMNLSDLSGTKAMKGRVQNFISFNEGHEAEDYLTLKRAYLDGKTKLMYALLNNPSLANKFFPNQKITNTQEFYTFFDKLSAVAEAQLREGSDKRSAKRVEGFLKREQQRLGLTDQERKDLMANAFPNLKLNVQEDQSLSKKERNWFWARTKRAGTTAAIAAVSAPIAGVLYGVEFGEAANLIHDVQRSSWGGVGEYFKEWGDVVKGDVPLDLDSSGQLVADLSAAQRGALWVRHTFIEPPAWGPHTETIDGVHVTLPESLDYRKDIVIGNKHYDGIVDVNTGKVFDMSNHKLGLQDINADGQKDLVLLDNNGSLIIDPATNKAFDVTAEFHNKFGIDLKPGSDSVTKTSETLVSLGGPTHDEPIPGVSVKIQTPDGTHWTNADRDAGWELVADKNGKVLLDDVKFDSNGHILDPGKDLTGGLITIKENSVPISGVTETVSAFGPDGVWTKDHTSEIGGGGSLGREWRGDLVNDAGNHTRNMLYAWKVDDGEGGHVVFDITRMAGEQFKNTGETVDHPVGVSDFASLFHESTGQTIGAGEHMGVFVTLSGDAHKGILMVDANNDGLIDFGADSGDQVWKWDGSHWVQDPTVSVEQVGDLMTNNGTFTNHGFSRVYVEQSDINDTTKLGALSLQDPNHPQGFGTVEVVKVGDNMTETYQGDTHQTMTVYATIRGNSPVSDVTIEKPGGEEFNPVVTVNKEITIEGEKRTPTVVAEYTSPGKLEVTVIPLPTRETIEKSVRGEPSQAPSTVSAPPAQGPQPVTPPIAPEEREQLKTRREALIAERKRIEEAIDSARRQGIEPNETQTNRLAEINRELGELEARLTPPKVASGAGKTKLAAKDLTFGGQEMDGSVEGATSCVLAGSPLPFEIYENPLRKGVPWLRRISPASPRLEAISQNGRITNISAGTGQVIDSDWRFRFEGKYYFIDEKGEFKPVDDVNEIAKIEARIKSNP